jgi:hypothetical protein
VTIPGEWLIGVPLGSDPDGKRQGYSEVYKWSKRGAGDRLAELLTLRARGELEPKRRGGRVRWRIDLPCEVSIEVEAV